MTSFERRNPFLRVGAVVPIEGGAADNLLLHSKHRPPHTFLFFNLLYIISLVQFESVAMVCLDERRSCWDRKEREGSTEWNYQISFALLSQFFGGGECCHLVECLCDKICASSRGNEHSILGGAYDATPCWFFSSPFERVVAPGFCVRSMESIESLASRFLFCESVT